MISFGTCSWKYESWQGILYPEFGDYNFLEEYSKHFNTVEIDQWFWSLYPAGAKLPFPKTIDEYLKSVPANFKFSVKVPNSLTLTHHYKSKEINPFFLQADLFNKFLEILEPMMNNISVLMFQFEYLNKQKMASLQEFIEQIAKFLSSIKTPVPIGIEIRNPNYLTEEYFEFLKSNDLIHIFCEGYYMPSITEIYSKFADKIKNRSVIRLLGPDRKEIENAAEEIWNQIVLPKDEELKKIALMLKHLQNLEIETTVNVNNHYEGSAPKTILRLMKLMMENN